ncbi:hypothetical protein PIB30_018956 [Stylosanthes scabra]|uniref:Ubiquitin-like protease family profile domain-containing protein n=1 Tax=Stylosanthes scabra TaxID=79078 RepID=A0ABU6Z4N6_9FABA|nr:hypothetical protein [Stylosanthes scabra]
MGHGGKGAKRGRRKGRSSPKRTPTETMVVGDEEVSCPVDDVKSVRRDLVKIEVKTDHHKDVFLEMLEAHGEQLYIVTQLVRHQAKVIESYGRGRAVAGKPPHLPPMGLYDMFPVPRRGRSRPSCNRMRAYSDQGARVQPAPSHVTDDADNANLETPLKKRLEFEEGASLEPHYSQWKFMHPDRALRSAIAMCLNLRFWPSAGMVFQASDIYYAAYIFKADGLQSEKLVQDEHCDGSRGTLWSLCPGEEVFGDVITLVAGLMNFKKKGECGVWWLPTTFARRYMGLLSDVQKIYVPIYAGRHWFLMIVNVMDDTLIYLDPLKHKDFCDARVKLMFDVGDYIESMLRSDTHGVFKSKGHRIPQISTYKIHEPRISQQDSGSNDCGVLVCEWMRTFQTWRDYDLQGEILSRAIESWDKQMVAAASSRRIRTVYPEPLAPSYKAPLCRNPMQTFGNTF